MTTAPTRFPASFWRYLAGLLASGLGDALVYIALPFLALALIPAQGSQASTVGLIVLAASLPRFFAPLLGSLADRWPPRMLLSLCALGRALGVLALGLLALNAQADLPLVAALAFWNGLLATLGYTAQSALLPRLVRPELLARANSLLSAALMGAPLVGYGLGGWLAAHSGPAFTLLLSVPCVLLLAVCSASLPRWGGAATGERLNFWQDTKLAACLLMGRPLLLALLGMGFVLNLALNLMNVRAPLHMAEAGRGAPDYAVFEMLISGGVLLGIALVGPLSRRCSLDALIGAGGVVLVLGIAAFIPGGVWVWWSGAAVFGTGLGLLEMATITRVQGMLPGEVRGRVIGVALGVNALGLTLGAVLASRPLPTSTLMLGLSAACTLLAFLWPLALRAEGQRSALLHPTATR